MRRARPLARRFCPHRRRRPGPRRFERKDTEQFHVCIGGPGLSRHDERRFSLRVLDTIFGGTSSSRLFQEVRETPRARVLGLLVHGAYQDVGQVGLYVGTRTDNLGEAMADRRHRARAAAHHAGDCGGARAREGEPEGPSAAGARVDRRADEPAGIRDAGRRAAARARRGRRPDRCGQPCLTWRSWPPSCGIRRGCRSPASVPISSASTRRWRALRRLPTA